MCFFNDVTANEPSDVHAKSYPHRGTVRGGEGGGGVIEPSLSFWYVAIFRNDLGLGQVDTTIYNVMKGYAISATVTELKMKLTFYYIVQVFVR